MPNASRCPYCHRAIHASGTGTTAFRAGLLLHMLRCEDRPGGMTDGEIAAAADKCVAEALSADSIN